MSWTSFFYIYFFIFSLQYKGKDYFHHRELRESVCFYEFETCFINCIYRLELHLQLFVSTRTSSNQASCTLGVWGAFDPNTKALVLDTEGMLGISSSAKQRKRLLLKVSLWCFFLYYLYCIQFSYPVKMMLNILEFWKYLTSLEKGLIQSLVYA